MSQDAYIDLHVHTTCSDGTFSPEEVVQMAAGLGIKVIAITDHDNVSGIAPAMKEAQKFGITVIPGIECSTSFEIGSRHILGYNINPDSEALKEYIKTCRNDRINKIYRILEKLNSLGIELSIDDVKKYAMTGSVGRPHIAQALLEKGYVSTIKEAFDKYIAKGKPAYATVRHVPVEEVMEAIIKAGGIPVLAHPVQLNYNNIEHTLAEAQRLMKLGLKGIEIVHPDHKFDDCYAYAAFALRNDLYVTCGSDYHGTNKKNQLGSCFFNGSRMSIEKLKKAGKTFLP